MEIFFYLLDVVDVVPARTAGGLDYSFYIVVAATIGVETLAMWLMKYNPFGKSLLHSFLCNIASLVLGFLLYEMVPGLFAADKIPNLLLMLLLTMAAELPVLYLLNRQQDIKKTLLVCGIMNVITYFLFYLFIITVAR